MQPRVSGEKREGAGGLAAKAILCAIAWASILANAERSAVRDEDICGPQNGRRLYLEFGERGILYAKNVTFARNERRTAGSGRAYASNGSHAQCSLELVTCPSCVILVTFQSIALSHHCGDGSATMDSPCRCDYVWISEPPYEDVSGTPFCGLYGPIVYRSSTRILSITLLYGRSHRHAFTLEYTAERNILQLRGTELTASGQAAKGLNGTTGGGILTSPFFPARYPRDLGLEYVIACPSEAPACRIRLLFSDFQLATVSIMEFYDWNGQRLDVSSGARFRPPVITSSGPSLLIRFYANGGTGLGYKAFYSFVIGHPVDRSGQPITDCGGYVENLGGAITMMDMVGEGAKTYDCVWLIRPPKNFLHTKTHMYLKVVAFAEMAGNTELVVKQGPTSALMPLEILRHPASQVQPPRQKEHVAPVSSGFHVRLRGTFGPSSHLAIAYAAFSYMDCFAGSDFLCQNHRCIPSQLNCDGFDHCGDNSDEPASCLRDWQLEPRDRKWHANKPNYYFPMIDRYPDLKTATLVFVASSLGLIVLISALIVLLYRMGARARQQRELQSRLQTISELLDGARIDEISVSDEPPVYEAPPGYEEVAKLALDSAFERKKGRSLPGESCCSSELGRGPARTRVPESPPPPYATPPGSATRRIPPGPDSSGRERIPGAEYFGAYPWKRGASITIRSADTSCDSQRRISLDASIDGRSWGREPGSGGGGDASEPEERPEEAAAAAAAIEDAASEPAEPTEPAEAPSAESDLEGGEASSSGGCRCEGACGCASGVPRAGSRRSVGKLSGRLRRASCLGGAASFRSVASYERLSSGDGETSGRARRYSSCDLGCLEQGRRSPEGGPTRRRAAGGRAARIRRVSRHSLDAVSA